MWPTYNFVSPYFAVTSSLILWKPSSFRRSLSLSSRSRQSIAQPPRLMALYLFHKIRGEPPNLGSGFVETVIVSHPTVALPCTEISKTSPPSSISISYGEGIVRRESIYSHHLTELMLFLPTFTGLVRTIWGWMGNISSTSLRSCSANSATIHSANPGSEWNDMINNDNPSCCLTTRPTLYLDSLALLGWRWALHASHTVIRPTCWRNVWNVSKYACLVS